MPTPNHSDTSSPAGVWLGLAYLDTLNIFFEDPDVPDGISIEEMSSSSVIVASLSSTTLVPLTSSIVAVAFTREQLASAIPHGISWVIVVALATAALFYFRRVQPAATA